MPGIAHAPRAGMTEKHPDAPGGASVEEELNEPTRESMRTLGRADLDEELNDEDRQGDDQSRPGQNSDWIPQ